MVALSASFWTGTQETAQARKRKDSKMAIQIKALKTLDKMRICVRFSRWWCEKDSNLRRRKPADLQSVVFYMFIGILTVCYLYALLLRAVST